MSERPEQGEVDAAAFFRESMTEHEFMSAIIAHAVARGWGEPIDRRMTKKEKAEKLRPYHVTISKKGAAGFPDLVMVRNGRQVIAELKREKGGRTSVAQRKWLDELYAVQLAIIAELCGVAGCAVLCNRHTEIARRLFGVYEWKPSSWPEIEAVLA